MLPLFVIEIEYAVRVSLLIQRNLVSMGIRDEGDPSGGLGFGNERNIHAAFGLHHASQGTAVTIIARWSIFHRLGEDGQRVGV